MKAKTLPVKTIRTFMKTVLIALAVVLAATVFTGCGRTKAEAFMTVDGEEITEDQFMFFCSLVLEDEAFVHNAYYDTENNFTEAVKKEAIAFAKEYICRYHEADKNGFGLTDGEKSALLEQADKEFRKYNEEYGEELTEDEYYDYLYGIKKKDYIRFRENWLIVNKYNDYQYENADISEEAQRAAYEKFVGFLNTKKTSVIVIDTSGMNAEEKSNVKKKAELILNKAKNGQDFNELMAQYSDDEELTESGGEIEIGESFELLHPGLYKWSQTAEEGDISLVTEDYAFYVVKCISVTDFDDLVNTETMISWTQFDKTQSEIDALVSQERFKEKINETAFSKCDISALVSDAIEYWTSLWNVYGFPSM